MSTTKKHIKMLKNYIKIAWKVLQRRKFFTFVSLFGISFTLMVLMVIVAFMDHLLSPSYPEIKRDKTLYISGARFENPENGSMWNGPPGFYLVKNYITKMKTPKNIGFYSMGFDMVNAYAEDSKKLDLALKKTDANFWDITDFKFLEGKPFNQQHITEGTMVAVINEATRDGYFGKGVASVGKYLEVGTNKYRIMGVVENVPLTQIATMGDIYVPYSTSAATLKSTNIIGGYGVLLLAASKADFPAIQAEYQTIVNKVEIPKGHTIFISKASTYVDAFAIDTIGENFPVNPLYLLVGIFAFLFMLLPTVNLVNLNITRIMERSSEIGVRKAFGASSSRLLGQFIVENLMITLIGGLIGIGMTWLVINWLNGSGFIPYLNLKINLRVLWGSLIVCLIFGLLSGVLPAYRMSKVHVVKALKTGEG